MGYGLVVQVADGLGGGLGGCGLWSGGRAGVGQVGNILGGSGCLWSGVGHVGRIMVWGRVGQGAHSPEEGGRSGGAGGRDRSGVWEKVQGLAISSL